MEVEDERNLSRVPTPDDHAETRMTRSEAVRTVPGCQAEVVRLSEDRLEVVRRRRVPVEKPACVDLVVV